MTKLKITEVSRFFFFEIAYYIFPFPVVSVEICVLFGKLRRKCQCVKTVPQRGETDSHQAGLGLFI